MTNREAMSEVALQAVDLRKEFRRGGGLRRSAQAVVALDGVSLHLRRGEIVALVGESGSGKSTLARVLAQLERQDTGRLLLDGQEVRVRTRRDVRNHVRRVQLMFQDPFASLNPMRSVYDHVARPLRLRGFASRNPATVSRVLDLLREVQLVPPELFAAKYPHQLSGGQRQRVSIARALAAEPEVMLADEPVSMLDVSLRLGVLDLLALLVRDRAVALLYITHDIASARWFASRAVVMYGGRVVEEGTTEEVVTAPAHPYTQLLVRSSPDPKRQRSQTLDPPPRLEAAGLGPVAGCGFAPRCPHVMARCEAEVPPLLETGSGEQRARCWLYAGNRAIEERVTQFPPADAVGHEPPARSSPADNR